MVNRSMPNSIRVTGIMTLLLMLIMIGACLPKSLSEGGAGAVNITLYGFSIMKESLEKGR